ncbi:MAG: release factor glutamine methyltransferase [Sphingomonadales bacterium]|jgi:release factor glutamine methyltransferase|nr:release factor glutamine methyltransferase [Sphingomonadales bacterium]MEA3042785.1 release factor glutamine methyltransferase [Sphingomonadales bacterium]
MKVREAITAAAARLAAVSDTPRLDAELLMAHALGVARETMILDRPEEEAPVLFDALIERRLVSEPVAYIVGRRAFWTIAVAVGPGALVPRPDSETLIEAALAHFGAAGPARILDLGTGPGSLLLAALDQWPRATGLGVDASAAALAYARRNANGRCEFRLGSWAEGIDERFDLVLCNPPYVEAEAELPRDVAGYEPPEALFAGADGLDAYRALAPQLARLLAPGGIVCLEIGQGQEEKVGALMAAEGFTIASRSDLNGIVRCLILRADAE